MKISRKILIATISVFCFSILQASDAAAGSIINLDPADHRLEITFVGNTKEQVILKPNESYELVGPWFEIILDTSQPITTDGMREYVIQKNKLVLMRIIDYKSGGHH